MSHVLKIDLFFIVGGAIGWSSQLWRLQILRSELRAQFRTADQLRSIISGTKPSVLSGEGKAKARAASDVAMGQPSPSSSHGDVE
jgi:hypothetical protein